MTMDPGLPPGGAPWEYKLVPMGNPLEAGIEERANAFGVQGWELVAIDAGVWVFKRPRQEVESDPVARAIVEESIPLVEAAEPTKAVGAMFVAAPAEEEATPRT